MTLSIRKSEVLSNIVHIALGDIISRAFAFIAFLYVARVLGPHNLGLIAFGSSAVLLVAPFIDFGLGYVGARDVSRDNGLLSLYIKSILLDRMALGVVSIGLLAIVALSFFQDPEKIRILLLYGLTLVPVVFSLTWAYQSIGQMKWFAIEKNSQALLYLAIIVLLVTQPFDFEKIPIAYFVSAMIPAISIVAYFLVRFRRKNDTVTIGFCKTLLRTSFKLFIPTLLSQLSLPIGILFLATMSSLQEAGYYSAASKIILLSAVMPNLLWSSYFAVLSRASASSPSAVRSLGSTLYKYAILIGIVPLFLGLVYPREIVLLLFGTSYQGAIVAFQLSAVVAAVQFISITFTRILPALGMDSTFSRLVLAGTGIQVVACIIFVPSLGAVGAASAYIAAEGFIALVVIGILWKRLNLRLWRPPAIACAAIILSYVVIEAIRHFVHVSIVPILFGIISLYVISLLATSVVSLGDFVSKESLVD